MDWSLALPWSIYVAYELVPWWPLLIRCKCGIMCDVLHIIFSHIGVDQTLVGYTHVGGCYIQRIIKIINLTVVFFKEFFLCSMLWNNKHHRSFGWFANWQVAPRFPCSLLYQQLSRKKKDVDYFYSLQVWENENFVIITFLNKERNLKRIIQSQCIFVF